MNSETVNRNLLSVHEFTLLTRKMMRKDQKRVEHLETQVAQQAVAIEALQAQLQAFAVRMYSGGPTSGD